MVILVLTPFDQLDNFVALLLFLPFLLQLDLLLRQIIALQFFLVAVDELYQLLLANILRDIFVALLKVLKNLDVVLNVSLLAWFAVHFSFFEPLYGELLPLLFLLPLLGQICLQHLADS